MATRWGCIGAGYIAHEFFTAIKENLPAGEHEFIAVASRDLSRAKNYADILGFKKAYGSYDELVNDPDVEIAYVATEPHNHAELSIKLMNAGKHVLCETPMAVNLKQVKKVLETAKLNNVFFMQGIWSRFVPIYRQVRKEIAEKTLGTIKLIRTELCTPATDFNERYGQNQTPELAGGGLISVGIYPVALACMVFGEMPESIKAVGTLTSAGVDDTVSAILKYKNGALVNISSSLTFEAENTAFIFGSKGTIKIESPMYAPTKVTTPSGSFEYTLKEAGNYNYITNSDAFHHEVTAVRNYLKSGAKEAEEMPHSQSEMIVTIMDEIRRQIGVVYPDD